MASIMSDAEGTTTSGTCHPDWAAVQAAFEENFRSRGEVGASVCIEVDGQRTVDLGAGIADISTGAPWTPETLSLVFSSTKGATALCAHLLLDRGELDLHAPVSRYWPGFRQAGKAGVTVAMCLDHSAGVPGFREPIKTDGFLDWDYVVERLEREQPFWEPGTRHGYHSMTFGWTVGELVRRVSGQSLGAFFQTEVAEPLGLDFWIGLPEEQERRVSALLAPVVDPVELAKMPAVKALAADPESSTAKSLDNTGGYGVFAFDDETGRGVFDSREYHAAELGGSGGITTARGLAGMYSPLALGGAELLSKKQVMLMRRVSMATHRDEITHLPLRFGLGYMRATDCRHLPAGELLSMSLGDGAFGHPGAGGSIGFADPDHRMSFGYHMNQMGPAALIDQRAQSLIDAAYDCLVQS
jgi:CubicO group peptidase (beta-lactamase class C family)